MLANSPNTVTELKAYLKIESHFAPTNTIRQDDFVPLQFRHFRSKPEILFCGRVVRDKGIEELIAAVGLLKNEGLECVLRVVGKADPAYQCQLQGIASTYSVRQQVYFEGFIPFGELLLQYYRNADLYVLPSWHEGFPHSIWEAAASCTPILATPVGGIPGNVSEDEIHFIQPKNPEEIAKKIKYLLESPEKAYNKIEAAYKRALNYTVEECSSQLFHILHHHAT
jgi:glycosyltransferase involved in cell wall biosynthesis